MVFVVFCVVFTESKSEQTKSAFIAHGHGNGYYYINYNKNIMGNANSGNHCFSDQYNRVLDLESLISRYEEENASANAELAKVTAEAKKLREKVKKLEKQHKKARQQAEQQKRFAQAFQQQNRDMAPRLKQLKQLNSQLKREKQSLESELAQARAAAKNAGGGKNNNNNVQTHRGRRRSRSEKRSVKHKEHRYGGSAGSSEDSDDSDVSILSALDSALLQKHNVKANETQAAAAAKQKASVASQSQRSKTPNPPMSSVPRGLSVSLSVISATEEIQAGYASTGNLPSKINKTSGSRTVGIGDVGDAGEMETDAESDIGDYWDPQSQTLQSVADFFSSRSDASQEARRVERNLVCYVMGCDILYSLFVIIFFFSFAPTDLQLAPLLVRQPRQTAGEVERGTRTGCAKRVQIAEAYYQRYQKSMLQDVKKRIAKSDDSNFVHILGALLMTAAEYSVGVVHKAITKWDIDEVMHVLCTHTAKEMNDICVAYKKKHMIHLSAQMMAVADYQNKKTVHEVLRVYFDVSGADNSTTTTTTTLVNPHIHLDIHINAERLHRDIQFFQSLKTQKAQVTKKQKLRLCRVFLLNNARYLRILSEQWMSPNNSAFNPKQKSLENVIRKYLFKMKVVPRCAGRACMTHLRFAMDSGLFFAEKVKEATHNVMWMMAQEQVVRIFIGRFERDLHEVERAFNARKMGSGDSALQADRNLREYVRWKAGKNSNCAFFLVKMLENSERLKGEREVGMEVGGDEQGEEEEEEEEYDYDNENENRNRILAMDRGVTYDVQMGRMVVREEEEEQEHYSYNHNRHHHQMQRSKGSF